MFKIDLLKGKGIPLKRRPLGVAIAALAFVVPVLVAAIMFGFYVSDKIFIRVSTQELANYDKNIDTLSEALNIQKTFEREKNSLTSCMSEAMSSLGKHAQWSPVLEVVARNMPDSMVLTKLDVKEASVKKDVPNKENPKEMKKVDAIARTMKMNVTGRPNTNNDKAVQDFKDRLLLSKLLAKQMEDIKVSQEPDTLDGQDVVSYEISCIFKPKI